MKFSILATGFLAVLMAACAPAFAQPDGTTDNIRKLLAPKLSAGTKIEAIRPTGMTGLYEVQVGTDVVYVNENATFLFQGMLIDLDKGRDLTRERREILVAEVEATIMPTLWSADALKDAVKLVKGNGSRKVVVFEDPYCGYCKKLRQSFAEMNDITVYTFMVAALSADSANKARDLWCSSDRVKAYDDWMVRNKAPVAADKTCADPVKRVADLAKRLGVGPVPHVVFADGSKNLGYLASADLTKRLATTKATF
jgi:thiol:disulfide interchange protein DsbC